MSKKLKIEDFLLYQFVSKPIFVFQPKDYLRNVIITSNARPKLKTHSAIKKKTIIPKSVYVDPDSITKPHMMLQSTMLVSTVRKVYLAGS